MNEPEKKSRNALDGEIIKLRRGLAIYKVRLSPFYRVRMRNPKTGKYAVKSTKETSRLKAREIAEEIYLDFLNVGVAKATQKHFRFDSYAEKYRHQCDDYVSRGVRNSHYRRDAETALTAKRYGILDYFSDYDVREISTSTFNDYLRKITNPKQPLSKSIIGLVTSHFRNIMSIAVADGIIPAVINTPKPQLSQSSPRPFFRFYPLVDRKLDQYEGVCKTIKTLASENVKVRGLPLTLEFLDLVQFLTNSFLRPTTSELYDLRHEDVSIEEHGDSKTLRLNVRKGKTGARIAVTMEACVGIYERMKKRHSEHKSDDYIFYPTYQNRSYVTRLTARFLNHVLKSAGLDVDPYTKQKHTMYSFRHTAITMRLVKSQGKINIFTLAKNAGTSVEMIENFYAKRLPITGDLVKNLQSFGE